MGCTDGAVCAHCSNSSIQPLNKVCVAVWVVLAIASYIIQVRLCFFCKLFHRLGMRGTLGSRAGAVRTSPCRASTLICCVRLAIFFIEFESTLCGRPGQSRTESRTCGCPGGLYRSASPLDWWGAQLPYAPPCFRCLGLAVSLIQHSGQRLSQ